MHDPKPQADSALAALDTPAVPTVPSPCVNICRMTADRSHCEGCWRTLDEIRAWRTLDDASKRAIWADIARRSAGAHTLPEDDAA